MSDGNLLQRFWSLASLSEEERIQAAKELITSLSTHQVMYNKNFENMPTDIIKIYTMLLTLMKAEHEGEGLCPELEYSLKRLVHGLASNRKAARHGYFITLTEVLGCEIIYCTCLCTRMISQHW